MSPVATGSSGSGLKYEYFELTARRVVALDTARVVRSGVVPSDAPRGHERAENFGIRLTGMIRVPADGLYEFALTSDDGSTLTVGGRLVVDNDDFHGAEEKAGMMHAISDSTHDRDSLSSNSSRMI